MRRRTPSEIKAYGDGYAEAYKQFCHLLKKNDKDKAIRKMEIFAKGVEITVETAMDEPSNSEKPNNCEHITEDGVTCAKYPACDDCLDNPLNKVKGSERLVKGSEQTDLVEDSPSLVKDLVKAFGEDGTWLERQGVYTLTLAEAKQRAVDIIESVLAKDEPTISKMEQVEEPQMGDAKPIPLSNRVTHIKDEPQTDVWEYHNGEWTEPQTDCAWK